VTVREIRLSGSAQQVITPGDRPVFSTQPSILMRPAQTDLTRSTQEVITQAYQAAPAAELASGDGFLTIDEFQKSLAKERDIYGACLQKIIHMQVEKLQEAVTAEVNKLNVRMDRFANAQQADISSEILQQFNARMDHMSAQIEKNANEFESIFKQTEDIRKMAGAVETINSQLTNTKKFCGDAVGGVVDEVNAIVEQYHVRINKLEASAMKTAQGLEDFGGVVGQVNAIAEQYQVRIGKLEASALKSSKSLEDLAQESQRLQGNDNALQQQHDCLQQQIDQKVREVQQQHVVLQQQTDQKVDEVQQQNVFLQQQLNLKRQPLDDNADLIARMTDLEVGQFSSKEDQNDFEREVHQLLEHLSKHVENYEARLHKLELGGVSVKQKADLIDALLRK
jgi:hypothetical protein